MKNHAGIVILIAALAAPAFAVGEKTLNAGGAAGWQLATRSGVTELRGVRPSAVLSLASNGLSGESVDLYLSFDEGTPARFRDAMGNYAIAAGEHLQAAAGRWARRGQGAALFTGMQTVAWQSTKGEPLVLTAKNPSSLFATGRNIADLSIEFFLYPAKMESGEEIFEWTATGRRAQGSEGANQLQTIRAVAAKNRLHWNFENFFIAPDGSRSKNITLSSVAPLTPGRWSHHLVRFDANSGLLEYLVDGNIEAAAHATSSGGEGSEVLTPVVGERGHFSIGRQFNGFIDELKISGGFSQHDRVNRYTAQGGSVETAPLDLGMRGSAVRKVDASGGVVRLAGKTSGNVYQNGGDFRFEGGAQMQFFIRTAETSLGLSQAPWSVFKSGAPLHGITGRFAQIRADFYPAGDLESAPYLEALSIEFAPKNPPKPPTQISAAAHDGSVEIRWKELRDDNVAGYLVYYGTRPGEYFGTEGNHGPSPVDVGKSGMIRLDNLKNGVLYYFAVAAYDDSGALYPGEFSKEASARPLRMLE